MFGLTKKQFLKRSTSSLDKTGNYALLIRELIDNETEGKIDNNEAYKQIKSIIKSVESAFFIYEELNPPSEYVSLHLRILKSLITLQEAASANYDFITASIKGNDIEATEKLAESKILLDNFRKDFRPLTSEVDKLLKT